MSTIKNRVTKVLDIVHIGDNSIQGSIIVEHGLQVFDKMTDFLFVISCKTEHMETAKIQCEELKLVYIIYDRSGSLTNI